MKIVYIAHPISGDIEANLADIRRIVRHINLMSLEYVPFVPYYADIVSLDDNNPIERMRGIDNDMAIMSKGFIDELWLTGDRISKGMQNEKTYAEQLGIKVVDWTNLL